MRGANTGASHDGREMLKEAEAHDGRLPHGRLEEIAKATGKGEREIGYRKQFAEQYRDRRKALQRFHSWNEL